MPKLCCFLMLVSYLAACDVNKDSPPPAISSKTLFANFEFAPYHSDALLQDYLSKSCAYYPGGNNRTVEFYNFLSEYCEAIDDAPKQADVLGNVRLAMMRFAHQHDSLLRSSMGKYAEPMLLEPISNCELR